MQIQIFRAANLQAALEEIREQLGPDASVLKTRQCRDGWMGWLGRSYVEVTASPAEAAAQGASRLLARQSVQPLDVRLLSSSDLTYGAATRTPLAQYRDELVALGVDRNTAERWIRSTSGFVAHLDEVSEHAWLDHLKQSVAREIRLSGPIRLNPGTRRVVALVGPTGVGKTTTIAKLAAGFRVQARCRVGLITIDTFRIAAVQQLQAYAQIMDLPMCVVETVDQMPAAIERLGDVDLILIDTTGRSPRSDAGVTSLVEMLASAQPDETHLVLSATANASVLRSAMLGFRPARPTSAIVTKLDEATYTAGVLSSLASHSDLAGCPISYLTHGQHVPDDIEVASIDRLVARLLPTRYDLPRIEAA